IARLKLTGDAGSRHAPSTAADDRHRHGLASSLHSLRWSEEPDSPLERQPHGNPGTPEPSHLRFHDANDPKLDRLIAYLRRTWRYLNDSTEHVRAAVELLPPVVVGDHGNGRG